MSSVSTSTRPASRGAANSVASRPVRKRPQGAAARSGAPRPATTSARADAPRPTTPRAPSQRRTAGRPPSPVRSGLGALPRLVGVAAAGVQQAAGKRAGVARPSLVPFVLLICAILVSGLLALLMLNTVLVQRAFTESGLRTQAARLAEQEAGLRQRLAEMSTTAALEKRAREIGLGESKTPAFVLPDGKVAGALEPAVALPPLEKKAEKKPEKKAENRNEVAPTQAGDRAKKKPETAPAKKRSAASGRSAGPVPAP